MDEVGQFPDDGYITFLDKIFWNLSNLGVKVASYELDHICYRVSSEERYEDLKEKLAEDNILLGESMINQRRISNYLLKKPLTYKSREIEVLELPAPKKHSNYKEGFEHVEFVVDESLETFKLRYAHLDFDESGFQKDRNRDLRLKFDGISVKFHEQSLKEVIRNEKS